MNGKSLVFYQVALLHIVWALLLLIEPQVIDVGALQVFKQIGFSSNWLAAALFVASGMGWLSASGLIPVGIFGAMLLVPQQLMVIIMAQGCFESIVNMQLPLDPRHDITEWQVVLAIQLPAITVGTYHVIAFLRYGGWRWNTYLSLRSLLPLSTQGR